MELNNTVYFIDKYRIIFKVSKDKLKHILPLILLIETVGMNKKDRTTWICSLKTLMIKRSLKRK